jgi:hypothetical protein
MENAVFALATFDDGLGGGPALYAGGAFATAGGVTVDVSVPTTIVAKWNGTSWSDLGMGGLSSHVYALTVLDDGLGGGPALYAAGFFTSAGGVTVNFVAEWNGTSWSALGTGMSNLVHALAVFDDGLGGGPALYAAGQFTTAGGVPAGGIAKWNGTSWSALGTGVNGIVRALSVYDDGFGGGPALYAAGLFDLAGGVAANSIAKWDGMSWSALGSGLNDYAFALGVFDDGLGGGPALHAAGQFTTAGGVTVNSIAKWDGASWSALGSGMNLGSHVDALTVYDDGLGGGPALYAGGFFNTAGGAPADFLAKWNGASWSAVAGVGGIVHVLSVFDDGSGSGPELYAGGDFIMVGGVTVRYIAKWNGTNWSALGSGVGGGPIPSVLALTSFDDGLGGGTALYAGGLFNTAIDSGDSYLAKWACVLAGGPFDPPEETPAAGEPVRHAVGDLDGEGTLDTAVVIPAAGPLLASGAVQVFRNLGNDVFGEWQGLAANPPIKAGNAPSAVVPDLFNNDPHLDLAVTNAGDDNVHILLNQGSGDASYSLFSAVPVGNTPSAITAADFNEDSLVDLAVTNKDDDTVLILIGDGNGNFTPAGNGSFAPAMTVAVGAHPLSVDVFDLGNDGDLDLAVVAEVDRTRMVQVLENLINGGKGLALAEPFAVPVGANANFVLQADFNSDGFDDLVTVNADQGATDGSVTVLLNTPPCPWDCGDRDGAVGVVDFLALLSAWGQADMPCDFDGGVVEVTDFLALLAAWGPCP